MAHNNEWFPKKERDLVALAEVWDEQLADAAKRTAFGWEAAVCSALQLKIGDFTQKWRDYQADDSSAKLLLKDAAKGVLEPAMREFARGSVRFNDKMSPLDKVVMGIRAPAKRRPHRPKPKDLVGFRLSTLPSAHRVFADYFIAGSESRGKGEYHAVEARWWVRSLSEPAPLDANAEGWHSAADTASPWEIGFDGADAGKRLYVAMRWENESTGEDESGKGLWSDIQSIIIP
jgi:hypothetical protein